MTLRFLPWLRAETPGGAATLALRVGSTDTTVPLQRLGPGDVQRLAETLTMERDPAPQSTQFPPSCLASVSFAEPAFPWLLTPKAPDARGLLVPWLALIVIGEDEAARAIALRPGALASITLPASRLPSFDELSALAHVQVQGPFDASTDLPSVVQAQPGRARARLLAAQRLAPSRRYLACLVPSFEAGRRAGLGEPVADALSPAPAWGGGDAPVTLPLYASWAFGTGADADIETLVRRLAAAPPAELPAPTALDLSLLGVDEPAAYRGLLRTMARPPAAPSPDASARLRALLQPALHTGERPRVGLPWLGLGQGAGPDKAWAETLNVDPALRTLAGLGAELVRQHQDRLVDAFWRQAGAVDRARRLFVGAELSAAVGSRLLRKHLRGAGAEQVLQALRPAASAAASGLFKSRLADGGEAPAGPAPGLRRVMSARRLQAAPAGVSKLLRIDPAVRPRAARDPLFAIVTLAAPAGSEAPVRDVAVPAPATFDLHLLAADALATVQADLLGRAKLTRRVDLGDFVPASDTSAVPRGGTALDEPLVPALTELGAALVFPAIDALPDDALLALALDGAAVEALLVGANDELVRELQWRGAPVRPDTTLLPCAWQGLPHPPIAGWDAGAALGTHTAHLGATVVLLSSAVVARLPGLDPWLVQARAVPGGRRPGTQTLAPVFRGRLAEDTVYFGFNLTPEQLAGRDGGVGWYFCFEQGPLRPRFGLDETPVEPMKLWSDLDWSRVNTGGGQLHLTPAPAPLDAQGLQWGADGAQMAAILLQRPIRFAIHGSQLPGLPGAG